MKTLLHSVVSLTFCIVSFAIIAIPVLAQSSLGKVAGKVKDAAGAVVSGVSVSLRDSQQAVVKTVVTDASRHE